jgi:formyltetrahydrofolate synthetase
MILASRPLTLLQHYGLPVIVALNRFGSDTEREFEMIRKRRQLPRLGTGVDSIDHP